MNVKKSPMRYFAFFTPSLQNELCILHLPYISNWVSHISCAKEPYTVSGYCTLQVGFEERKGGQEGG